MNFKAIHTLFDCAISQIKYPRIRLQTAQGRPVVISRNGGKSKNPGHLSVTNGGKYGTPDNVYYGRIAPDGQWFASSYSQGNIYAVQDVLTKLAANPAEVAGELGRLTGNCVFCETPLNDPRSTAVGYGPICAEHFGLPWDAAKEARKAAAAAPVAQPKPSVAELATLAQKINATHDRKFLAAFAAEPLQAFLADGAARVGDKPTRNERLLEHGYQAYAREEDYF